MRRPQTKQPYAYRRKATRTQGRPVHRLYRPTPREAMHGRMLLVLPVDCSPATLITFEHANFETQWWGLQGNYDGLLFRVNEMRDSPTPGRLWNAQLYALSFATYTGWDEINVNEDWTAARFIASGDPPCPIDQDFSF